MINNTSLVYITTPANVSNFTNIITPADVSNFTTAISSGTLLNISNYLIISLCVFIKNLFNI